MSIVIAVRHDGKVTFCADTQTSYGTFKKHYMCEKNMKISWVTDEILVGRTGSVALGQRLLAHPEWFKLPKSGLTKRFLVQKIVPLFLAEAEAADALKNLGEEPQMDASFLFGYRDKLFWLTSTFDGGRAVIGSGRYCVEPLPERPPEGGNVREQILAGLRLAEEFNTGVGGPFVLLDTESRKYEFVR